MIVMTTSNSTSVNAAQLRMKGPPAQAMDREAELARESPRASHSPKKCHRSSDCESRRRRRWVGGERSGADLEERHAA